MASPFSNATFEIRIDPSMFSPSYFSGEKSMNPEHTPESLAAAVRSLADKDNNADLSGITKAVERANAERKGRIERALRGSADLAVMAGAKGKRFLITYWSNDTAHTAHGIEYPIEKRDSGGDPEGTNVLINDEGHPFWGKYASMTTLRKNLDDMKLTYHIAYFDN